MSLRLLLVWLRRIITISAVLSTVYLYLYPVVYGCAFPSTSGSRRHGFDNTLAQHRGQIDDLDTSIAPFRLLVLADPQLEGDSSLPDPDDALWARIGFHWTRLRQSHQHELKDLLAEVLKELALEDIPRAFWAVRKTLDLFGNDYYLAHIYRTLHWWTKPTHVTVLGDLIGSQWVSEDEFAWRGWRYWNRVFAGAQKVDDEIMSMHQQDTDKQTKFALGTDASEDWSRKAINIAGNHDIGYAGDISKARIERFEQTFGKANWDVKFSYPAERIPEARNTVGLPAPEIHLIVLNSMLLDTPALDHSLQDDNYAYINSLISQRLDPVESRNSTFTLLLTHVPLHKPEGVCTDAPFFDYWDFEEANGAFKNGGLKEQNHLGEFATRNGVLQSIYGMSGDRHAPIGGKGRNGLVLNGHDHEGCDTVHYIEANRQDAITDEEDLDRGPSGTPGKKRTFDDKDLSSWKWKAVRATEFASRRSGGVSSQPERDIVTSLREITLRSMMGEYSGNAGLLSLWYDFDAGNWDYQITMCPLGVQHTWWAVHVLDIIAVAWMMARLATWLYRRTVGYTDKTKPTTRTETVSEEPAKQAKKRASNSTVVTEAQSAHKRRRKT